MNLLEILLTGTGSFFILLVVSKLSGNRQISELTMFDYINSITIGSIAADAAMGGMDEFLEPTVAMVVFALLAYLVSILCSKSLTIRRLICGRPYILLDNQKLFYKNFKKCRLDMNEFLTACRCMGYNNIADIQTAIMEPSGRLSFIPVASVRTVTCADMNLQPVQEKLITVVMLDGKLLHENLRSIGMDENRFKKDITAQKIQMQDVFLGYYDQDQLTIYKKDEEKKINERQI